MTVMVTPNFAPKSNKSWTSKELEQLISLKNEGFGYKDIADHLGRTEKAVQVKMSKWNNSMAQTSKRATAVANEEPFDIAALVDGTANGKPEKPKYYLRNAEYAQKEQAKAMGALWDTKCWFIPDDVVGAKRELLISTFGPVMYGNHTARGKHKWASFVPADEPSPDPVDVKVKPKRVTQKKVQPVVKATGNNNVAIGNSTVAVGNSTDAHVFTIRIPKRLVWGVLVSALVVAAWYVGKSF
jgi:hypothetical protein